jgi:hypothetical protein
MPRQYRRLEPEERFVCVQSQVRTEAIRGTPLSHDDSDVFARSVTVESAGHRVFVQRHSLRTGGIAAANDGGWQKSKP